LKPFDYFSKLIAASPQGAFVVQTELFDMMRKKDKIERRVAIQVRYFSAQREETAEGSTER
jgi:hypothetical protein